MRSVVATVMLSLLLHAAEAKGGEVRSPDPVVVLVTMSMCCPEEAWPEAEQAARSEFLILGLEVVLVEGEAHEESTRRRELQHIAEARNAACAVRIVKVDAASQGGIDLWIDDQVTGKTVFRHLPLSETVDSDAAEIAGLRLVEVLKAGLLELNLADSQAIASVPPVEIEKIAEPKPDVPPRNALAVGGTVVGSVGDVPIIGSVGLSFSRYLWTRAVLEMDGLVSVAGRDMSNEFAKGSFHLAAVRMWLLWQFLSKRSFRAAFGVGGGGMVLWGQGSPSTKGYEGESDAGIVGYVGAELKAGYSFSRHVGVELGGRVGVVMPEVAVRFAEDEVATFGRPLSEGFANLVLEF